MSTPSRMPGSSHLPKRTSLADSVYDILLARLIDGTAPAESTLNIDGLARELAVSQTPIREALARLESTGLVHRAALKGYRVAPLFTDRELSDLMDARAAIEPATAFFAAQRSDRALLGDLEAAIDDLERVSQRPGPGEYSHYWEADQRFHDLIASHSDNPFLQRAYESLGGHVHRFRLFGALGVTDAEFAIVEHRSILAGFVGGEPVEARAAMALHIANVKERSHRDREAVHD